MCCVCLFVCSICINKWCSGLWNTQCRVTTAIIFDAPISPPAPSSDCLNPHDLFSNPYPTSSLISGFYYGTNFVVIITFPFTSLSLLALARPQSQQTCISPRSPPSLPEGRPLSRLHSLLHLPRLPVSPSPKRNTCRRHWCLRIIKAPSAHLARN